jgi:predicted dehydrogenase
MIGAGNHAGRVLIPAFARSGAVLHTLVSQAGVCGSRYARQFKFCQLSSDASRAVHAKEVNTVIIATRHDSHAEYVCKALRAGKHVFVEKPIALTMKELTAIETAYQETRDNPHGPPRLMVGFNRRFAPHTTTMKGLLNQVTQPAAFVVTVNAGSVPREHWTHDPGIGGGRILGEACHFVDLLRYLSGAAIEEAHAAYLGETNESRALRETATLTLKFTNGSFGTVHYFANGQRAFPKERVEVFCGGRILQLDNFRVLRGYGWPRFRTMRLWHQDKGHQTCAQAFMDAVSNGGASPIPPTEIFEVGRVMIELAESGQWPCRP